VEYTYGNDLLHSSTHYFLTDALGSTRELVDDSEALTDSYVYTPYGELANHNGTSTNSFLFTGEQYDSETDNYYLRARYYSPSLTRFLTRDTYDGTQADPLSQNHYLYAGGNPVMYVDPSGRMSILTLTMNIPVMNILSTSGLISAGITGGILFQLRANKIAYISPQYEDQSARPGITNPIHHFYILASPISGTGSIRYDFDVEPRNAPDAIRGKRVMGFIQKSITYQYSKNFVRLSSKQFDLWEWLNYDIYPHSDNDPSKVLKHYSRNWINCLSWTIAAYSSAMTIMLTVPSI
jgi:RHS repeat-associated protein